MSKLTKDNPNSREMVTEILDKAAWWGALKIIIDFLKAKGAEQVHVEFGFVLDRDLKGKPQGSDQTISLSVLEDFIQEGLSEETIEWAGGSDFVFRAVDQDLAFMLCNDADLHFASADSASLLEFVQKLRAAGVKVYENGRFI